MKATPAAPAAQEEKKKKALAQSTKQLHFIPALTAPRGMKGIADLLPLPCRAAEQLGAPLSQHQSIHFFCFPAAPVNQKKFKLIELSSFSN